MSDTWDQKHGIVGSNVFNHICAGAAVLSLLVAIALLVFSFLTQPEQQVAGAPNGDIMETAQAEPKQLPTAKLPVPVSLGESREPSPRLKPGRSVAARSLTQTIDKNAAWISTEHLVGIVDFHEYTEGKADLEDDTGIKIFDHHPSSMDVAAPIKSDLSTFTLKRGENLASLLQRANIRKGDKNAVLSALADEINLRSFRAGTQFNIKSEPASLTEFQIATHPDIANQRVLLQISIPNGKAREVVAFRETSSAFFAETQIAATTLHYASIKGTIEDSLFASAERAGTPRPIVAKLANLFLYDIDFQREIRKGEQFEAVYEVYYDNQGNIVDYGDVVYGRLTWLNQRQSKGYYRHQENGTHVWFDANGKSARRLLMKTPIEGARITSGFGNRRHPVLGYTKKHKGVDFGAGRGTPIMAAGDGKVLRANAYGSFGNYVKIQHANGYQTAYAHLNGFGSGIRAGARVRQGQIIGYVGATGRVTGPHLHYEVLHNGRQVNPMKIKVATGKVLTETALEEFQDERNWIDSIRIPPAPVMLASSADKGKINQD